MGVLYILDEPSIGLHQRDNDKLLQTLKELRDLGNTLLVNHGLGLVERQLFHEVQGLGDAPAAVAVNIQSAHGDRQRLFWT